MALLTTTIGSYPKPDYVPVVDWFRTQDMALPDAQTANEAFSLSRRAEIEALLARATHEVVREQAEIGIDVPTDGEMRRENYVYYHCRHLDGIDFARWTTKSMRGGKWRADAPTIVGPIRPSERFLPSDWRIAQSVTSLPIKITIPGPLTISDTLSDGYYGDQKRLCADLADAINVEVRALVEAGCAWIQIDEPVFAVEPEKALAFGIENLERCFHSVPANVMRVMHMCCGYPARVDLEDYPKADPAAYFKLADALDASSVDAVSIEDAHRHNDLCLLERFQATKVILGVIAIARTRVEPVDEIAVRLEDALEHIDASRLIAAPDCGLGMLDRATIRSKLTNMVAAARSVGH